MSSGFNYIFLQSFHYIAMTFHVLLTTQMTIKNGLSYFINSHLNIDMEVTFDNW